MAFALSEEQLRCCICQGVFNNPVSIPCGHNFCMECIERYWDTRHKSDCPLCKETFIHRPNVRVNVGLKEITEQFQRSLKVKPEYKPVPQKRRTQSQSSTFDRVPCDICHGNKLTAVKSCLDCHASYCEIHLRPHRRDPVVTKHRLTDPAASAASHLCRNHNKNMDMFCKTDQAPVCMKCTETDHKDHEIVPMERESKRVKTQMKNFETDFQEMVHDRMRKTEEMKHSVEMNNRNKEREIQTSVQIVTMVISAIEKNQDLLIEEIEQKQEEAGRRGEQLLGELEQEIDELQRRRSELQHLKRSEDPLHLMQSFPCLSAPLSSRDWSKVRAHSDIYIGTVRRAFSKLVDLCNELDKKLSAEEVTTASKYEVAVTLDPATAAGWLVVSPDGKKVSLSFQQRRLSVPDDPRRFDSCVAVLGKESFTSGRCYWVVQVGGKTDWDLGVAKESINRKGAITICPDAGYWAICRRKGGSLSACAGPSVTLQHCEIPQNVGIFLDYEEGLVSFYNTEGKTHIYTYSGCNFTEPLYPYLNPCLHDNGKNMAPLVICPVGAGFTEETAII